MSAPVTSIVAAATALYGKIVRAYDNLQKLGANKITIGAVDARLQNLENLWSRFDGCNDELLDHLSILTDDPYVTQDIPALGEEAYLMNKGLMLDLKCSLQKREPVAVAATAEPAPSIPRTTLPRIQLPTFTGKYEDWPSFRDLFLSLIGRDKSTRPVEKMHYLKSCVKGEADLLIRNLSATEANYERAWQTLTAYYENKRLLTRAYLGNFLSLQKMKGESAAELRKIFHGVKSTVSALEGIDRPIGQTEDLFVHLAVELLDTRSRREWETSIDDSTEPPVYATLERFLERRLHTLESIAPTRNEGAITRSDGATTKIGGSGNTRMTRSHHSRKQEPREGAKVRCSACQGDHFVMFCEVYRKKTASERKQHVADSHLCTNCLGRHQVTECSSKKNCSACGDRHHSSLHDAFREPETIRTSHLAQGPQPTPVTVLLATARVRVSDRYGAWHPARALIDQGSESSIISEGLAQRLRLPRSSASVAVFGVGGKRTGVSKGRVTLTLQALSGRSSIDVEALVLPKLTIFAGGYSGGAHSWPHLQGLELADPDYRAVDPVDILLGADAYGTILCQGLKKGGPREPIAQQTTLGWILSGVVGEATTVHSINTHHCQIEDDVANLVRRFWEQEELPRFAQLASKSEQKCEEHFQLHHSRDADGRYVVRLPTIEPLPDFTATRRAANRALQRVNQKLGRESDFRRLYVAFMNEYLDLDHMKPAPLSSADPTRRACYLPHHGVLREGSTSTKLRVVFNGSSSLPNGDSLNRYLLTGPNLLPALADILLRWRQHRYVFTTDIEKMYRQIRVHPDDQDLQRILWREAVDDKVKEYWLTTITYGLSCAPFLAIRTLHQLAADESHRHPEGAAVLRSDVYMDDILSGASTLPEAKEILQQLVLVCKAGGFPLKKWSANHRQLLDDLPAEDCIQHDTRWWQSGEGHAMLGLRWQPCDDQFSFITKQITLSAVTKRSVLSLTAKLFDPLGWLSPSTILAKILIQTTWLLGVDWDMALPDDEAKKWRRFHEELPRLEDLHVSRWLGGGLTDCYLEVHGFADASVRAYAAVVYLKTRRNGENEVKLVAAKTKVAPLKQISLPRLELSAATLLVRLVARSLPIIDCDKAPLHLWSDSTVTLGWIRGHPSS